MNKELREWLACVVYAAGALILGVGGTVYLILWMYQSSSWGWAAITLIMWGLATHFIHSCRNDETRERPKGPVTLHVVETSK